jgi:hypothetical protein
MACSGITLPFIMRIFEIYNRVNFKNIKLHNEELHNFHHLITVIIFGDQMMENEMGGTFSTNVEDEKCQQNFSR